MTLVFRDVYIQTISLINVLILWILKIRWTDIHQYLYHSAVKKLTTVPLKYPFNKNWNSISCDYHTPFLIHASFTLWINQMSLFSTGPPWYVIESLKLAFQFSTISPTWIHVRIILCLLQFLQSQDKNANFDSIFTEQIDSHLSRLFKTKIVYKQVFW